MPPKSERVTEEATGDRQSKSTGGGDRDRGVWLAGVSHLCPRERAGVCGHGRTDGRRTGGDDRVVAAPATVSQVAFASHAVAARALTASATRAL